MNEQSARKINQEESRSAGTTSPEAFIQFLHFAERLKCIERHGWTSTGRTESVADHSWRLALMALLSARYLEKEVDLAKLLKIAIVHDLVEIFAGDIPYFLAPEGSHAQKFKVENEHQAMDKIRSLLGDIDGEEIASLWYEYEDSKSYEAQVVRALNKIEAQLQQNEADISTWLECEAVDATNGFISKSCEFDVFLTALSDATIAESRRKAAQEKSDFGFSVPNSISLNPREHKAGLQDSTSFIA